MLFLLSKKLQDPLYLGVDSLGKLQLLQYYLLKLNLSCQRLARRKRERKRTNEEKRAKAIVLLNSIYQSSPYVQVTPFYSSPLVHAREVLQVPLASLSYVLRCMPFSFRLFFISFLILSPYPSTILTFFSISFTHVHRVTFFSLGEQEEFWRGKYKTIESFRISFRVRQKNRKIIFQFFYFINLHI